MTMFRTKQRRWWIATLTVGLIMFAVGATLQAQAHGQSAPATPVAAPVEHVLVASVAPVASIAPVVSTASTPARSTAPVASVAPTVAAQPNQTLVAAIDAYMQSSTEVHTYMLEDEQIVGDTARVLVVPPPNVTDPAFLFARKGADGWTVLNLSTWFPQEFYQSENIPAELWIQ